MAGSFWQFRGCMLSGPLCFDDRLVSPPVDTLDYRSLSTKITDR